MTPSASFVIQLINNSVSDLLLMLNTFPDVFPVSSTTPVLNIIAIVYLISRKTCSL